jgi:hypothetical protein
MINHREFKLLKSGAIDFIPLPDGYQLSINCEGQIFLSRGGKRKYYLSDKFVKSLYCRKQTDYVLLLIDVINELDKIGKRLKPNSINRTGIESLIKRVREM